MNSEEKGLSVIIGIISYFPDDEKLKLVRMQRLQNLLQKCDEIFKVPILIIAQNWKGVSIESKSENPIYVITYDKPLGIIGARKELRTQFLKSGYDYLIMLDDDCEITGDRVDGALYLKRLIENPGGWASYLPHLLKLFAISKEIYSLVDFPEGGADDANPKLRYFEDQWLDMGLKKLYPEKQFNWYKSNLNESSDSAYDEFSTGWHEVYDSEGNWIRRNTGDNTRFMLSQVTRETYLHPETLVRRLDAEMFPKKYKLLIDNYQKIFKDYHKNFIPITPQPTQPKPKQPHKKKKKKK